MRPCLEGAQVLYNVLVVEVLQQIDFAHDALQVVVGYATKRHLFDRNCVPCPGIEAFVNLTVSSPTQLFTEHVLVAQH